MGRVKRETADDEILEWIALLERARVAAPDKVRELMRVARGLVEGHELMASVDALLVLGRKPTKRYKA